MSGNQYVQTARHGLFGYALQKFWIHRDLLWTLYLFNAFLIFLRLFTGIYLITSPAADTVVGFLFNILTTPITVLGLSRVLMRVMLGEPVRFSMMLTDFSNWRSCKKALAASVLFQAPSILIIFLISVDIPRIDTLAKVGLVLPVLALIFAAWLWLLLKLFLLPYLLAARPAEKLPALARASFENIRGKMWRTIGMYLSSAWMVALLSVCLILLADPLINHAIVKKSSTWLLYNGAVTAAITLVGPYTGLVLAGYASRLMARGGYKG